VTEATRARYPDVAAFADGDDGVRVAYEVYGDGPDTVVLLPPWAITHSRVWKGQIAYLARHFRVIAIDPRGNGRSDHPPATFEAYSRDAHLADVIAILDTTATDRAAMVSLGPRAPLGLALAIEHPDRVSAEVFITPDLWLTETYIEPFSAGERDRYEGWEKFNPEYWQADYSGFIEWWATVVYPHPHSTRQIEQFVERGLQSGPDELLASTLGLGMYERDEALELAGRIRCPTLVIQNGGDTISPIETSGPLAEACGGKLVVLEGLGPEVVGRWPVAMNIVLREFLESVRAGTAIRERVA
jgi:pimeloyl-ACP methyl ester carboxylesterase